MKKLIFLLLFVTASQAQNFTIGSPKQEPILTIGCTVPSLFKGEYTTIYHPVLVDIELKKKIEIDGHIIKFPVFFKATLDGIEIYDKDKNQYKKRNCSENDCKIIHLDPKNDLIINSGNNWQYFTQPTIQITN